jgi:hypothetical protein
MSNMMWVLVGSAAVAAAVAATALVLHSLFATCRRRRFDKARDAFRRQREWLEADFLSVAGRAGMPRGLRWKDCDFCDEVTFARDRETGRVAAFVAVTISFEAVEGGGMEDVEAVGNLRSATAVFHYDDTKWTTQGRAIMNLEPAEAIQRFERTLELMGD